MSGEGIDRSVREWLRVSASRGKAYASAGREDTTEMLDAWSAKHQPPYEIVTGVASSEVDRVNAVTLAELRAEAVPATFVTNRDGNVLIARWGVPTVSDIRRLLWQDGAKRREAASAIVADSQAPGNEEA